MTGFSLKDQLFNPTKLALIAGQIKHSWPAFDAQGFQNHVLASLADSALKQRIELIAHGMAKFLPDDFESASDILIASLPAELDPSLRDDDFGDFIYACHSQFVAIYGLQESLLDTSFSALHHFSRRFSAEYAVRYFINAYPEETYCQLRKWTYDPNYHIRRLVSESSRPKLPWGISIACRTASNLQFLKRLQFDCSSYVRRSVANHLNDLSKKDSVTLLNTLEGWMSEDKLNTQLMPHALRSLQRAGEPRALALLGLNPAPQLTVQNFKLDRSLVSIGSSISMFAELKSLTRQTISFDLRLEHSGPEFRLNKYYKIEGAELGAGEVFNLRKSVMLRQATTYCLQPGDYNFTLRANAKDIAAGKFSLIQT